MADGEIYGTETLWRGFGNYIFRNEQYDRSLKYYDLAVSVTPKDKSTLLSRARARARCNNYEGALEDIQNALRIDSQDLVALAEKANTTFLNTEFEQALIQNYRLLPKRRKPDDFFLGIMKCYITIEQCLGEIAGKPLRDYFLIIRRLAWEWNIDSDKDISFQPRNKVPAKKKKEPQEHKRASLEPEDEELQIKDSLHSHKSDKYMIPHLITNVEFSPLQKRTSNIEDYMAEKYLERMYRDKRFLKQMFHDSGLRSPNQKGMNHLKKLAKDTFAQVHKKQEVLRTSRPFYFLKYQEAKISGKLQSRQAAELMLHQQNYKKEAEKILQKLEIAYQEKRLNGIIEMCEKMISYCEGKPKRLLPDKDVYIHKIHEYLRKGFYEIYRLNKDQVKWDRDKRIMVCLGQPISRDPSTDSVISQFGTGPILDLNNQIEIFKERLEHADPGDETCWCYHELARFSMLTKKYENARVYAKKCMITIENESDMEEWYLNLQMLLLRTSIRQKNKQDALAEAQEAYNIAESRKDNVLKDYLKRMIVIIQDLEFDDITGAKITEKRKKKILALMTNDKMKEEFTHLFRNMASQPTGRRLSIVPASLKPPPSKEESVSALIAGKVKVKSQGRMSVTEEANKPPEGAEFMKLMKFHV